MHISMHPALCSILRTSAEFADEDELEGPPLQLPRNSGSAKKTGQTPNVPAFSKGKSMLRMA
jgi:hypothetical protein